MISPRISVVTLGVNDMPAMRAFYRSLGWREEGDSDVHAMFHTGGGILALFPFKELAADASVPSGEPVAGFRGFTLAINLEARDLVDDAFAELRNLGVRIIKEPAETDWGGYSGYFADPEGNLWEIAWGSFYTIDDRGGMIMHS
jgi:uncharacterized protein